MKKALSFLFILVAVALIAAPVAQAQAQNNPFAKFGESVRRQFNKIYLMVPGNKPGAAVLDQTTEAMKKMTSVHTTVSLGATASDTSNLELFKAQLAFSGPMKVEDVYDPSTFQQDLNMRGELGVQGTTLRANADLKFDGDVVYFNIHELPALPNMNLAAIQNQWLKFEREPVEGEEKEERKYTDAEVAELEAAFKQLVTASQISEARREDLDGKGVFVVDISVPDEALVAYTQRVEAVSDKEGDGMTEKEATEMRKILEAVEPIKVTVWVDRGNYFLRRTELPLVVDAQKLMAMNEEEDVETSLASASPLGSTDNIKTVKVNFRIDMDKFNEPVSFSIPTDARKAEEVFGEVFGMPVGGVGMPAELPTSRTKLPAGTRPTELPELTPEELEILKQYGVSVEEL